MVLFERLCHLAGADDKASMEWDTVYGPATVLTVSGDGYDRHMGFFATDDG